MKSEICVLGRPLWQGYRFKIYKIFGFLDLRGLIRERKARGRLG